MERKISYCFDSALLSFDATKKDMWKATGARHMSDWIFAVKFARLAVSSDDFAEIWFAQILRLVSDMQTVYEFNRSFTVSRSSLSSSIVACSLA